MSIFFSNLVFQAAISPVERCRSIAMLDSHVLLHFDGRVLRAVKVPSLSVGSNLAFDDLYEVIGRVTAVRVQKGSRQSVGEVLNTIGRPRAVRRSHDGDGIGLRHSERKRIHPLAHRRRASRQNQRYGNHKEAVHFCSSNERDRRESAKPLIHCRDRHHVPVMS